ncbi:MAG: hypothetical protein AAF368_05630 [Planctomycetota bacterium]
MEQNSEPEEPEGFGRQVPLAELIDLARLERESGRKPSPKTIREALPEGWVLCDDGLHAARDRRLLFKDGWILLLGLVCFGAAGLGLFWSTFPRGWRGITRFAIVIVVVLLAGGLVAPIITRSLNRRS